MATKTESKSEKPILSESTPETGDLDVPNWLNGGFLEKHLRTYFDNEKLEIVNLEVQPATAKGENYASCIYRVKVNFKNHPNRSTCETSSDSNPTNLDIIVKAAVAGELALKFMTASDVYNKEIEFYNKIAPKINNTLRKWNESSQLLAESYGVSKEHGTIVFEDLKTKNYCISSIFRGFNFDEAKAVLEKAATFHAINAVMQEEEPDIFENFKYGLMSRHTDAFDVFYLTQLDMMTEVLSEWSDGDYYIEKMKRVRTILMDRGANAFAPDPNHFNTLIHGDLWVNNLMIKHKNAPEITKNDATDFENIILLDFQYSCWTSPAIDLHYFFNNSLQESLRPHRFDELIAHYHKHLEASLLSLGYKKEIPSFEQFKQQYLDKSFYGFVASCLIQPLMINEETANADLDALIAGDERSIKYKQLIYSSPKVRANLRKIIPIYDKIGIFD